MHHQNAMTVVVNVRELIATLKSNRERHAAQVETARKAWLEETRETLYDLLHKVNFDHTDSINLHIPGVADHTKDYDRAIGMLERHVEPTLALTCADYARFVDDDWDWKQSWMLSNSKYLGD